jgi:D-serine deaminase-like pyridoxal phosphate-dependent protein
MAEDQLNSTPDGADTSDDASVEDKPERFYIVVLMPEDMKAKLKEYADAHDTNPTSLARKLLAECIDYDLVEDTTGKRTKYANDEERKAAHKLASKKSGLLRKALFQTHMGQIKKRPELLATANRMVLDLSEPGRKFAMLDLEALDTVLDTVIKSGK